MGKRKAAKKPQGPKKREPLPTSFPCLFCNHENSVSVKMDKKSGTGELSCKVCGQQFQTGINYLSAAVDVYSDWVDACDAVAKDSVGMDTAGSRGPANALGHDDSDDPVERQLDAEMDEDEIEGEADYDGD